MKKLFNKTAAAIVAVTMAFCLTACGGNSDSTNTQTQAATEVAENLTSEALTDEMLAENETSTETVVEEAPETSYPVEIADTQGEVITLDAEPERVVSVAPNLTELMYKLDAGDKLVGRSDYCDYPEEVSELESVGSLYTPDIEKIISLEPDVVIVSTHFNDENTKKLEEVGIPVITLYDENDVNGVYDMITTLGTAMNRNSEAAACVSEMKATIKSVVDAVEEVERPSVYYVVGFGEYGDFTAGGDTFIGGLIDLAGGDNIAKDVSGWNITLEEIVEADPSIIVISESNKEAFMSDANYADLTAVQEGNVYTIDTNLLDRQGYRNAEGVKALAEIFHPEVFE
jgi:iron complex transport system substrate-binding protein